MPKDVPVDSDEWEPVNEPGCDMAPLDLSSVSDIVRLTEPWMKIIGNLDAINVPLVSAPALKALQPAKRE